MKFCDFWGTKYYPIEVFSFLMSCSNEDMENIHFERNEYFNILSDITTLRECISKDVPKILNKINFPEEKFEIFFLKTCSLKTLALLGKTDLMLKYCSEEEIKPILNFVVEGNEGNNLDCFKQLNINCKNDKHLSLVAASKGYFNFFKYFIENNYDIHHRCSELILKKGNFELLKLYFNKFEFLTENDIEWAIKGKNEDCIKFVLSRIEIFDYEEISFLKMTPKILDLLLEYKPHFSSYLQEIENSNCFHGNLELVEYIVSKTNTFNNASFKVSIKKGIVDCFNFYINRFNIDRTDLSYCQTAYRNNKLKMLILLRKRGFECDNEIYHCAVLYDNFSMIRYARVNNFKWDENYFLASKNKEMREYLIKNGFKPSTGSCLTVNYESFFLYTNLKANTIQIEKNSNYCVNIITISAGHYFLTLMYCGYERDKREERNERIPFLHLNKDSRFTTNIENKLVSMTSGNFDVYVENDSDIYFYSETLNEPFDAIIQENHFNKEIKFKYLKEIYII